MNISSDTIREKLLQESGLKLERAVDMCRSMEATSSYLKYMAASAIPTKGGESAAAEAEKEFAIPTMEWDTVAAQATTATIKPKKKCQYSRQVHKPRACPAWGRQCSYCGKMNHARDVCRKAEKDRHADLKTTATVGKKEAANAMCGFQGEDADEAKRDHFAYALHGDKAGSREWNIILEIKGRGLKAKVDTGATCNVMPLAAYQVLCQHPPQPTSTKLTAYGGGKLDVYGKTRQEVLYRGLRRQLDFVVVRDDVQTLIDLPSVRHLGILVEQKALALSSGLDDQMPPLQRNTKMFSRAWDCYLENTTLKPRRMLSQ